MAAPDHDLATTTPDIERINVHSVYNIIAPHFDRTRYKPWPRVAEFLQQCPLASLVADVGCGNGKYLDVSKEIYCIGSDRCGICKDYI